MEALSHYVRSHWIQCLSIVLFALVSCMFLSLRFGAVPVTFSQLLGWLSGQGDAQSDMIIGLLRLPRGLLAGFVGALLACCGAVTQGLFRNPLADPSLIGVSAGASVGASIVIVLFSQLQWNLLGLSAVTVGAFIGGILAVIFVYRIATSQSGTSVATMLLAGIAITYLAGSLSNIFEFIGDNEMLRRISLWRMGGLDSADNTKVMIIAVVAVPILFYLCRQHGALNALLLGESEARHLGIDVTKLKRYLVLCVAAGVGTCVALSGSISFVGLVVPHMVRIIIGPNHRYLLPLSACFGAMVVIIADAFARTVIAPTELPVGMVTALLGAPVFISLLRSRHHYGMR